VKRISFFSCWSGQSKQRGSGGLFIAHMYLLPLEVSEHRIYLTSIRYVRWRIQIGSDSVGSDISDGARIYSIKGE
jgi:hypothetical protein